MTECPHGYPEADSHRCAMCRRQSSSTINRVMVTDWHTAAHHALVELAGSGRPFTSEDLTDLVGLPGAVRANGNNAVGAFIQANAQRLGLRRVDLARARNKQAHGRLLAVWVGRHAT